MGKFCVVREMHSQYYFSKWHNTISEAQEEAERLCRKHNDSFIVLEAKGQCFQEEKPIKWITF